MLIRRYDGPFSPNPPEAVCERLGMLSVGQSVGAFTSPLILPSQTIEGLFMFRLSPATHLT